MDQRPYSLRLNLLALISVPIILAGTVVGGLALYSSYHEIDEIYDVQLVHAAKLLLDLTRQDIADTSNRRMTLPDDHSGPSHEYERKISFRIWKDNALLTESLSAGDLGMASAPPGFSRQQIGDTEWHFYVHVDDSSGITVEVAEHSEVRTELIIQILSSMLVPALIFAPVILFLIWFGVTRSLTPMIVLARQINQRGAEDLTSLEAGRIPREIMPFITALNRLFSRVDLALRTEREFTDNAAHELRTPLAAMKTQAQVLQKHAASRPEQREDFDNLIDAIDRATRMVEQLLAFSRLQHMHESFEPVDIGELTRGVVSNLVAPALKRNQDLRVEIDPKVAVTGSAAALSIMVRNLVDNAIKYTPRGGEISVRITTERNRPTLIVEDSGPGIPTEYHQKVFNRFYRIARAEDTGGSGLGLAMVRWIVELHKAEIVMENLQPRGLRVKVMFG